MNHFKPLLSELAALFGYKYDKYDDLFFEHLKAISIPNTTVCGKEIKQGDGCWNCKDCELDFDSIYCNDCFIKEKHLGHEVYFKPSPSPKLRPTRSYFCDCGIYSTLK